MALQFPLVHSSTIPAPGFGKTEVVRRTAGFHPSVWGDYFLTSSEDTKKVGLWAERVEELKELVKRLMISAKGSVQEMDLIDDLQRLGVAYHFEKEIDEALQRMYGEYSSITYDDLRVVALRFRLLRQEGYNVSSDVFTKFKDDDGHFKGCLSSDVRGLLSLYEASHLSTHGEDILDEAIVFTSGHLESLMPHLDHHLARRVGRALELPLRKRITRMEARYFISDYEGEVSRNVVLLELAKLDFNVVQSLHRRELKDISRWWKDIDVPGKLSYARDRLVECFFWTLTVYFEPQYSRARLITSKMIGLFSLIDDTYDAYGTLEELEPFTDAIQRFDFMLSNMHVKDKGSRLPIFSQLDIRICSLHLLGHTMHEGCLGNMHIEDWEFNERFLLTMHGSKSSFELGTNLIDTASYTQIRWDMGAMDQLPEYMQVCFGALLRTVEEIERLLTPEERAYRIPYLKEVVKALTRGYLVEAQWFNRGYIPAFDEYMRVALTTTGYPALALVSFVGMGEVATKEAFEWVMIEPMPKMIRGSSVVCRIVDDIQSNKFEQERGHVVSAFDYTKEHGASEQEVLNKFQEMLVIAWKDMNEECLKPTRLPTSLLMRPVNLARLIQVLYMNADEYTHSSGETKAKITALLVDPIPLRDE